MERKDSLQNNVRFSYLFQAHSLLFNVLPYLLIDQTTKKNIVWATDSYLQYGAYYRPERQMFPDFNLNLIYENILLPRSQKPKEMQKARTKKKAEVATPKPTVAKMCDILEAENPGCFDNPDNTFIDPYMKSGLYVTEIVKRLFRSKKMKEIFPDDTERLQWIFSEQVYGLAPTKIIYAITTHYIFWFADKNGIQIDRSHFREFDSLKSIQNGTFAEDINRMFAKTEAGSPSRPLNDRAW
jgi:hypothetical protein